jgi:hypothetical protein
MKSSYMLDGNPQEWEEFHVETDDPVLAGLDPRSAPMLLEKTRRRLDEALARRSWATSALKVGLIVFTAGVAVFFSGASEPVGALVIVVGGSFVLALIMLRRAISRRIDQLSARIDVLHDTVHRVT